MPTTHYFSLAEEDRAIQFVPPLPSHNLKVQQTISSHSSSWELVWKFLNHWLKWAPVVLGCEGREKKANWCWDRGHQDENYLHVLPSCIKHVNSPCVSQLVSAEDHWGLRLLLALPKKPLQTRIPPKQKAIYSIAPDRDWRRCLGERGRYWLLLCWEVHRGGPRE